MLAMFDRIKSIFFPINSHKRKCSESLEIINENNSFYETSAQIQINIFKENNKNQSSVYNDIFQKNNGQGLVYKDSFSDISKCNVKKFKIDLRQTNNHHEENCKVSNNIHGNLIQKNDISLSDTKIISNNNNNNNVKNCSVNPELTDLSIKSKSHLLNSNFIANLIRPSVHNESREKRLQRLQVESCVNKEEIKKYDGSYIEDITEYFRELCSIPPVVFPRIPKKIALPKITDSMRQKILFAITNRHRDCVIVEEFNLSVTVTDLISLQPRQWLTDNIINFYLELIYSRNNNNGSQYPSVQILTTFFYAKLCSSGYAGVKRWTKKRPIFDSQMILVPIHLGNHWCFVLIDMCNQEVLYYDSLKSPNPKCLEIIKQFLIEDSKDKLQHSISIEEWTFKQIFDGPSQLNGYDCGVFLSQTAEYVSRRAKLDFTQDQMQYFREKMSYEILTKQLL